jgi:hypothetical protein
VPAPLPARLRTVSIQTRQAVSAPV